MTKSVFNRPNLTDDLIPCKIFTSLDACAVSVRLIVKIVSGGIRRRDSQMNWDPVEVTQKRRDARIGGGRVGRVDGRAGGVNSECLIGCTGPRRRRQEQNRDGFQLRVDTRVILVTAPV